MKGKRVLFTAVLCVFMSFVLLFAACDVSAFSSNTQNVSVNVEIPPVSCADHMDFDGDGLCDDCQFEMPSDCENHTDLNGNGRCDLCGNVIVEQQRLAYDAAVAEKPSEVYSLDDATSKTTIWNISNRFVSGTRKWQGVPAIEAAPNGRLWAAWYSGGEGECRENYVVLSTSEDGVSWEYEKLIIDHSSEYIRTFDPALWTDPNGYLWVIWNQEYTYGKAWGGIDGRMGVFGMYSKNPNVANPKWSRPVRLCDGVCVRKPTALSSGEWLLSSYIVAWHTTSLTNKRNIGATFYRFDGYDKPWPYYSKLNSLSNNATFCEQMTVELPDGSVKAVVREPDGLSTAVSKDKGKTWEEQSYLMDGDKKITNVSSEAFITRLKSGALLLAYNSSMDGVRRNLTAALSYDGGKTWPYKLLIDARSAVSYPDCVQTKNGDIYLVYDKNRNSDKEILMVKISEKHIITGNCPPKTILSDNRPYWLNNIKSVFHC